MLFSCCCSVLTLYRAEDQVALVLCRERTVWPVRNVVPTTAPIYPHKFPSKLTILTQARPTNTLQRLLYSAEDSLKEVRYPGKEGRITYKKY